MWKKTLTRSLSIGILGLVFILSSCSTRTVDAVSDQNGAAVAPTMNPASGSVTSETEIELTSTTVDATIYYTTDGAVPDESSTLYNPNSKPTVTSAMTLKAIAVKSGYSNSAVSSESYTIAAITVVPQTYVGGSFTGFNGNSYNHIAKLSSDGTLDINFNPGAGTIGTDGANGTIYSLAIQSDGKVLIGGYFDTYNNIARHNIARINTDGTLDTTFDPGLGTNEEYYPSPPHEQRLGIIDLMAIQNDGKILIAGNFMEYDGVSSGGLARINTNGTLDDTFNIDTATISHVQSMAIQSDGKIIVAGSLTTYEWVLDGHGHGGFGGGGGSWVGNTVNVLARINTNGTADNTFNPGLGADGEIYSLAIQNDGKILIGGTFTHYNTTDRNRIARIESDGTVDNTFNPGLGADGGLSSIIIQSTGKILISGTFTSYDSASREGLARIESDGTIDNTFDPGLGATGGSVYSVGVCD